MYVNKFCKSSLIISFHFNFCCDLRKYAAQAHLNENIFLFLCFHSITHSESLQKNSFAFFYLFAAHNRILNTVLVPDSFSARAEAVERSYVYRLAVVKRDVYFDPACRGLPFTAHDAELSSRVQ